MIIDLQRKVIKIQLRRFITAILFFIVVFAVMFFFNFRNGIFGMSKFQFAGVLAIVYFGFLLYEWKLGYNYIYYNDQGDKIVLRYFSLSYFSRQKSSIEILKDKFAGYELRNDFFGLKKMLVLKYKLKDESSANFPVVNLSILSTAEIEKVTKALDRWCS